MAAIVDLRDYLWQQNFLYYDLAGPVVAGDHLQCDRKPNICILVYGIDEHPMNAYLTLLT